MARATETIVLYIPSMLKIVAEVYEGEEYNMPPIGAVYIGTLVQFMLDYPDYTMLGEEEED